MDSLNYNAKVSFLENLYLIEVQKGLHYGNVFLICQEFFSNE